MKLRLLLAAGALALGLSTFEAQAAPMASGAAVAAKSDFALSEPVQYRGPGFGYRGYGPRYGGYYAPRGGYGWRYRGGAWPWVGLAAGVAAGAIIYSSTYRPRAGYYYDTYAYDGPYYYPSGYSGDPRDICARHFKSFERGTGMYTTYGGERRLCPYLQ